ncbi:MAG: SpoIIE family protein phosphatase, partial [Opitutales bacterium]
MWSPSRSLVWRLSILILGGAGLVLAAVMLSSHLTQSRLLIHQQQQHGEAITLAAVNRINDLLGRVEACAQGAATSLDYCDLNRDSATFWLRSMLEKQPEIDGLTLALSDAIPGRPFTILHAFRDGDVVKVNESEDSESQYINDWYYLPLYMRRAGWVEPYFDHQSQKTTVTYTVPVFLTDGNLYGVASCELSLEGIREMLDALPLGESGMALLLSDEGVYISHPVRDFEMRETIFSIAESLGSLEKPQPSLMALARKLLSGQAGMDVYRSNANDAPLYIYYRPVPLTGWAFAVTIPESQVLAPLRRQNNINLMIGLAGALLLLGASIGVAFSITRPLHELAAVAGRLAVGDFDAPMPKTRRRDEIGRLASSFARMREDLRSYIEELTTTTAAKEKIASEMAIAHQIQLGIVPKLFPPFPNRKDLDLYALLDPARDVGGDLYDFSLLDEDHLYVAIGDVSGKGVPASLLMAVGKTLLKSTMQAVRDPARALTMVNDELSADNESCMFITAFCGVLNLRSGHFTFANAGHNPPLVITPSGMTKYIRRKPGPALGAMCGARYQNMDLTLGNEEMLLLYTDGVTEAMNPREEMYGEDRLREIAAAHNKSEAQQMIRAIAEAVRTHADGEEQSDDITMLAVRSKARALDPLPNLPDRGPDTCVALANRKEDLNVLVSWLEAAGESLALDPAIVMALNLALEEWFINVVSYAFSDDAQHRIEMRLWKTDTQVLIQIEDDGQPF